MPHAIGTKLRRGVFPAYEQAYAHEFGIEASKLKRLGGANRLLSMSPEARALMLGKRRDELKEKP